MIVSSLVKKIAVPTCILSAFALCLTATAQEEAKDYPLGPIGGSYRVTPNSSMARISALTAGAPGAVAGLKVGDCLYGAFGETFTPTGSYHYGVSQELGFAVDRAESGTGVLPLQVVRPGAGGFSVNVALPAAGAFGVAYPRNSPKFDAVYETAVADLHTRAMNGNGSMGYLTGWTGLALLGHPNWNDTTGAKPYRLSINKIRDYVVGRINACVYAPVEDTLFDGTANPNYVGGAASNWELGQWVMFLSEYYARTGESAYLAPLQRGAEMCSNTIQWWKQPALNANGYSPGYNEIAGIVAHGGVIGDYIHLGWGGGINIVGCYVFNGMAFAKRAGVNMSARPHDGHDFGYATPPAGAVPAGMESYDHTISEKFLMQWNWMGNRCAYYNSSSADDGHVAYTLNAPSGYDAGGRTPATILGLTLFSQGETLSAGDQDKLSRLKGYITRNYMRHQEAHAYCVGAQAYQALATPFLDDRQQRFFMDNWRFFFALSRTATNGYQYFPSRSVADNYLDTTHCAALDIALPYGIAKGNYTLIPGYNTNRTLANFKSPYLMWPQIAARACKVTTSTQAFQVDACDGNGNVLAPGSYTAAWSHVSGPATATFSSNNTTGTTVTFPSVSATPYRIRLTITRAGVPTLTEDIDITRSNAVIPTGNAITAQPVAQTVAPGGSASFSVTVSGTGPILYQWRRNGVAYWGTSASNTLSLTNLPAGAAGSYDCVVTTPTAVLVSNAAPLTLAAIAVRTPGGLKRETWNNLGGGSVADLTGNSRYPMFPDATAVAATAETAENTGDSYGERLSGWIVPPTTGTYRFFLSSDDNSEIWLSTDDSPANLVKRASLSGYSDFRNYTASSANINLVAGQRYSIEILHKEGGGGDHLSVAWQTPGGVQPATGTLPIDGTYLEYEGFIPLADQWKLDDAAGTTAVDSVRTANNGTHQNGALVNQAGAAPGTGKSVSYDGTNDSTSIAAPNYNTDTLTVLAWVKRNGTIPAWAPILFCRAGNTIAGFGCGTANNLSYHWNGLGYDWSSGLTLPDGQWVLAALVVKPTGVTIHMRGASGLQSATQTTAITAEEFNGVMSIGADTSDSTRRFKGNIDDLRVYKGAFTTADIESIYQAGQSPAPVMSAAAMTVAENAAIGTAVGTVTATDANAGQTIAYSIVSGNTEGHFALDPATGAIIVASPPDFETTPVHTLVIGATDNGSPAQTTTAPVAITVTNVNEAPAFASNPVTGAPVYKDNAYSGTLTAFDPDMGSSYTLGKLTGPGWLSISPAGALTGTPSAADAGLNSFTVRATDNTGLTTDVTLNISVINPADAPIWTNPAGGSWLVAGNWFGNAVATGSGITADFATLDLTADTAVTLDGARTLGGLKFGDTSASHNWALTTGSGGPLTLQASSGSPVIHVVNQTATIGSALDGTTGLTKSGAGTLVLAGANTYTGDTLLTAGILRVGSGGTSGNLGGTAVTNNGILEFSRSDSLTVPQSISGTGKIYVKPGGTFTFSGALSTGTFRFDVGGSRTVTFSGSAANAINVIEDSQDGHGNLYFAKSSGVNAFSGPVLDVGSGYASQFLVRLDNSNQIPDTTSVRLYGWDGGYGGRSWFRLNGFNETIAGLEGGSSQSWVQNSAATPSVLTLAGAGSYSLTGGVQNGSTGTLGLTKSGPGFQTLSGSLVTYTGPTSVTNGTLRLSQTTGFASATTTVTPTGILELTSTNAVVDNWKLNSVLTGAGVINKTGVGWIQTNTNSSTFSGTFNIMAGTYGTSSVSSNWSGVTADFNVASGALLDARGQAITLGGLNGDGLVGTTWTTAASVTLGAGNKSGAFSGTISGNAGSATNLTTDPNAGVLSLVKTGTGTQTLSGANTYTGTTTVSGGTLLVTGSLATTTTTVAAAGTLGGTGTLGGGTTINGTLIPGGNGIGTLTVNNTLTLAPGSKLTWEFNNWTGSVHDKLASTSLNLTATSANRITIRPVDLALANFTDTNATFVLVQTTSGIAGFSADKFTVDTSGLTIPHGTWAVQQSGNNLVLAYTANPDANGNGILDSWETAHFGNANTGANLPGDDADEDGLANLMEYALDTNPMAYNAGPAVDFETITTAKHLRITVNKNPQATNLSYIVETCGAPGGWSAADTVVETNTATQLIVRDTFSSATASRRFIRLRVVTQP